MHPQVVVAAPPPQGPPRTPHNRAQQADLLAALCQHQATEGSQRSFARRHQVPRSTLQRWQAHLDCGPRNPQEVAFFESPAGVAFLQRLQVTLHLVLGLTSGCGLRPLCTVLRLLGVAPYLACSYGAQRLVAKRLEEAVVAFGQQEQQRLGATMPARQITLVEDETFHPQTCLVAIEPVSNFILVECYAARRDAATWTQQVQALCQALPVQVQQVVSDEAKALKRHAQQELGVTHSPDLFHLQHEVCGALAAALAAQERAAKERLEGLTPAPAVASPPASAATAAPALPAQVTPLQEAQQTLKQATARRQRVRQVLTNLSRAYHPFDLETGLARTPAEVETDLGCSFAALRLHARQAGLEKTAGPRIDKAARLVPALVATITCFHALVRQRLGALELPPALLGFLQRLLVPALYLGRVAAKAPRAAARAQLRAAADRLLQTLRAAPAWSLLPEATRLQLEAAAQQCADLFQRASSCVEGRNGQLALHHQHRHRLSPLRLGALTVVHNYFLRRPDGTTAAQRFFGAPAQDLFGFLCQTLPLPARPRQRASPRTRPSPN